MAIDGADQISSRGWLVKGGGAPTRAKMIAGSIRLVDRLHPPVPLGSVGFGLRARLARLGTAAPRHAAASPDGGIIADFPGPIGDPADLVARLAGAPEVVQHGLFPAQMVSLVLVGRGDSVQRIDGAKR